jgi:REP element-mobilizing transposase RayT
MKIEFNNLYTHFVFITLKRQPIIPEKSRIRIEKYITGIVNNNGSKLYAVYANPEHIHILVSRSPILSEVELATIIADSSEKFINENKLVTGQFRWQQSAAAFSVSKSGIDKVCKYILNQPEHHKRVSFAQEYDQFLKFYEANSYKVNKVGLWGSLPGY